jgi:pyrroline-5-carboxylate reductase
MNIPPLQRTVGIIGTGSMGGAIAMGLAPLDSLRLVVFGRRPNPRLPADIEQATDAPSLAAMSDILIVAVKPYHVEALAESIRSSIRPGTIVVSLAAGVSMLRLYDWFGQEVTLVRAMPNVAAEVGASVTALFSDSQDALQETVALFRHVGTPVPLATEQLMHAFIGVAGSAPAFAFLFAEALADGAVAEGMPRADARRAAAAMLKGAALLLEAHAGTPAELKDRVASPGGTTIEGLHALEKGAFRSAVIDAVRASAVRSRQMEAKA